VGRSPAWLALLALGLALTACRAPIWHQPEFPRESAAPIEGAGPADADVPASREAAAELSLGDAQLERGEPIAARSAGARAARADGDVAVVASARVATIAPAPRGPPSFGSLAPLWKSEGPKQVGLVGAAGDVVVVSSDGYRARALDARTGRTIGAAESLVSLSSIAVGEGRAAIVDRCGRVTIYDADLSVARARVDVAHEGPDVPVEERRDCQTKLAIQDGSLLVARAEAIGQWQWLGAFDLATGELRFDRRCGSGARLILATAPGLVVTASWDTVTAIDLNSGRRRWQRLVLLHDIRDPLLRFIQAPRPERIAIHDGHVLVGYPTGQVEVIDADTGERTSLIEEDPVAWVDVLVRSAERLVPARTDPWPRDRATPGDRSLALGGDPQRWDVSLFDLGDVVVAASRRGVEAFSTVR
jgi:hypothetical protein